jgi:protocatechuate 3,4-dioxygenase beta subunit
MRDNRTLSRRQVIAAAAALGAIRSVCRTAPAFADSRLPTPRQTTGPFYPRELPLDRDNDLVKVAGAPAPAKGQIAHVAGRVLDIDGRAVPGARIEIWQCNAFGRYHHPRDTRDAPLDPGFQGYGETVSAADGGYRFRTIRPVPYPGRTPHIHFAITAPGDRRLVTQMYVAGEPLNARDMLLNSIGDPAARAAVIVALAPAPDIEAGALAGTFDIVLARDGRFG